MLVELCYWCRYHHRFYGLGRVACSLSVKISFGQSIFLLDFKHSYFLVELNS